MVKSLDNISGQRKADINRRIYTIIMLVAIILAVAVFVAALVGALVFCVKTTPTNLRGFYGGKYLILGAVAILAVGGVIALFVCM